MIACQQLGRMGRLGNQLFQIASTVGIARQLGDEPIFPDDWIYRAYFSVPKHMFAPLSEIQGLQSAHETHLTEHIEALARPYLQDVELFVHQLDEISEYFKPSPLALSHLDTYLARGFPKRPRMAIHVRRGDTVAGADPGVPNNTDYRLCMPIAYYKRAEIEMWADDDDLWALDAPATVIVSDDPEWCEQHFSDAAWFNTVLPYYKEFEPEYGNEIPWDWLDLFALSRCDAFIITGSTFGIWGALLADVPPYRVLRPNKVYGPLLSYVNENLMFLSSWRQIDVARFLKPVQKVQP